MRMDKVVEPSDSIQKVSKMTEINSVTHPGPLLTSATFLQWMLSQVSVTHADTT
jgi:hypothetical protein